MDIINERKRKFDELAIFPPEGVDTVARYKSILVKGVQIAILCKYLPSQPLIELTKITDGDIQFINAVEFGGGLQRLQEITGKVYELESNSRLPTAYFDDSYNVLDASGQLQPVKLEKEVIFTITGAAQRGKNIRLEDGWACINLTKVLTPGEYNTRIGAKFTTWWGIETIHYVYTNILTYNKEIADRFIQSLYNLLDNEQKGIFQFLLSLLKIPVVGAEMMRGGNRITYSTKKKNIRRARTSKIQRGGEFEKNHIISSILHDINRYIIRVKEVSEGDKDFINLYLDNLQIDKAESNIDTSFISDDVNDPNFISTFSVFSAYETIIQNILSTFPRLPKILKLTMDSIKKGIQEIYMIDENNDTEVEKTVKREREETNGGIIKERVRLPVIPEGSSNEEYLNGENSQSMERAEQSAYGGRYPSRTYRRSKHLKRKARKTYKKNA